MVRSMLLRGFDRECVDKIDLYMQKACIVVAEPGVSSDPRDVLALELQQELADSPHIWGGGVWTESVLPSRLGEGLIS